MYVFNNTDGSTGSGYSSKGNQLKFGIDNKWYKADFLGYEGAAEYAASKLLEQSNIMEYVLLMDAFQITSCSRDRDLLLQSGYIRRTIISR